MSGFDPGPGWCSVDVSEPASAVYTLAEYGVDGEVVAAWVRVAPVPPLPTEPYTVIRVTWRDPEYLTGSHIYFLASDDYWVPQNRNAPITDRVDLQPRITRYEVLAEPCHEHYGAEDLKRVERDTAKAVLDEVTKFLDLTWQPGHMRVLSYDLQTALFAHLRDRFGVSS